MITNRLIHQYLWLADLLISAGSISRREIDARWRNNDSLNPERQSYDRKLLRAHLDALFEIFGFETAYDARSNTYRVSNLGDLGQGGKAGERAWLADAFFIRSLEQKPACVRDRVLFESFPASMRMLQMFVAAMSEGRRLRLTYCKFGRPEEQITLEPYCLKQFRQLWYVVGKADNHPDERYPRTYALDRIRDMELTDERYQIPDSFSPEAYFADRFGVDTRETPVDITIRVSAETARYLLAAPLHTSQRELIRATAFSVFSYHLAPTYDFIQALRAHGPQLELLSPEPLRQRFACDLRAALAMYE